MTGHIRRPSRAAIVLDRERRVMWSNWHRNKNDISTAALDLVRSATTSILVSASYIRC